MLCIYKECVASVTLINMRASRNIRQVIYMLILRLKGWYWGRHCAHNTHTIITLLWGIKLNLLFYKWKNYRSPKNDNWILSCCPPHDDSKNVFSKWIQSLGSNLCHATQEEKGTYLDRSPTNDCSLNYFSSLPSLVTHQSHLWAWKHATSETATLLYETQEIERPEGYFKIGTECKTWCCPAWPWPSGVALGGTGDRAPLASQSGGSRSPGRELTRREVPTCLQD